MTKSSNLTCRQCGTPLKLFGIERHAIIERIALRTLVCPACDAIETDLLTLSPPKRAAAAARPLAVDPLGHCGFDDEATRMLGRMFDSAWAKLKAAGGPLTAEPMAAATRELLARCVMALGRRATAPDAKLDEKALLFLAFLTQNAAARVPSRPR